MQHERSLERGVALAAPPRCVDGMGLFFDFDGTLVELADRPDAVVVDDALLSSLAALAERLPGRVAIVSGRSLDQLDQLLGGFAAMVAVAGSHGAERRDAAGEVMVAAASPSLVAAMDELLALADTHGVLAERKTVGAALHYRRRPDREAVVRRDAAAIARRHGVALQHGKMMVELRADGDKGQAIDAMLRAPSMRGMRPLFFGDDVTDEDGFVAAAKANGGGVLVGDPRATAARYRLDNVASVRGWIDAILEQTA